MERAPTLPCLPPRPRQKYKLKELYSRDYFEINGFSARWTPPNFRTLRRLSTAGFPIRILCGREALLSEAYLGHPVAEYLVHKHSGQFAAEVDHPVLCEAGPGRTKQIDYALLTRDAEAIEVAIECKWISITPYDKQRIVNDILRLECVRAPGRHVKRFLLVAGRKEDFERNFRDLKVNVGGARRAFTTHFLSQKHREIKTIRADTCEDRFQEYYTSFSSSFNSDVPKSFKTRLVGRRTVDKISVYIWQISSVRNRRTFSPQDAWG